MSHMKCWLKYPSLFQEICSTQTNSRLCECNIWNLKINFQKSTLLTNKNSLTHYYNIILNSVKTFILVALSLLQFSIEMQFQKYLAEKSTKFLPAEHFFYMWHMKCWLKYPSLFQKICSAPKNSWLCACNCWNLKINF